MGIGIKISEKPPKEYLDKWIEEVGKNFNIEFEVIEHRGGLVPVGGFLEEIVKNNFPIRYEEHYFGFGKFYCR